MRRLVAALMVAMLVFVLAACGGGGEEQTQTPSGQQAAAPPPAEVAEGEAPGPDRSPLEETTFEAFPRGGQITPTAILENLEDGKPMIILFYDWTQPETDDISDNIGLVMDDYRGMIELITFDMRKADPKLPEVDPELKKAAQLADRLGVKMTPYILIVDSQGLITWRWRGPADQPTIEREVMRATQ